MDPHKLFNEKSEIYASVRPHYPKKLFKYLASQCNERIVAWDAACGNGQAAISLTRYFDEVYATDISEQQIAYAIQDPRVTYSVQPAEATEFQDNQFDLVCVAQALHWFDYEKFWPEVRRVLKPGGIFAAWGYSWFSITKELDELFQEKFLKTLEPYWADQNKLLWDHYRNVPFPLERIAPPKIKMMMEWDLNQLFGYLRSWSATRLCIKERGETFFVHAYDALMAKWGNPNDKKCVEMDFCMLIGRTEI